ncbi:hypothetical protein J7K44_02705, partial [bacterium]|nr:hypothetical protein [bacterium]
MKKSKKISLRFYKRKGWLVFSGNSLSILSLVNLLKEKLSFSDFDYKNDLGIIKLGKKKGAREAVLFFKTKPIIGLLLVSDKKKKEKETVNLILTALDLLYSFSQDSGPGKMIAGTLFELLEELIKKKSFEDVQLLEAFVRKLKKCSEDELWDLAIFVNFPEDILNFAKFIKKKKTKKINLEKNIREWYKITDIGRKRVKIEKEKEDLFIG